jgi:glycosyltransferase involved in cell wall biosynthesis
MKAIELHVKKEPQVHGVPVLTESPMVSVCITAYNHAPFIEECIQAVLAQKTDFDFEILIGEDDSQDGTREICEGLANKYPNKIKLFLHHRENVIEILGKKTGRFNLCWNLNHARGEYIALCDGDDFWMDPLKLQKQVDILEKNEHACISAHAVQVLKEGQLSSPDGCQAKGEWNTILDLAEGNFIHTASCMFRSGMDYPDWLLTTSAADFPLHMLNATKGDIHFSPEVMAVYRDHPGGIWSSQKKSDIQLRWIHLLLTLLPHFKPEVQAVLLDRVKAFMAQILKESHVAKESINKKWFEEALNSGSPSEKEEMKEMMARILSASHVDRKDMDLNFLSSQFKAVDLLKALFKKITG